MKMNGPRRSQVRQPRLAEMIAAQLRDRILTSEFGEGSTLPKQEDLLGEFGVSPPSMREALRILETEGLVSVQRGNVGGAVVHQPQLAKVAYMLALVMQAHAVTLADVSQALHHLDPACAAECARQPERKDTILPYLREVLDESHQVIDDPTAYMASARRFHEEIVGICGNQTLMLVVGTLEMLWSMHVRALLRDQPEMSGEFGDLENREASLRDHEELFDRIAEGDERGAEESARRHLIDRPPGRYPFSLELPVVASVVRGDYGNIGSRPIDYGSSAVGSLGGDGRR
jgi:GntR family transcriptional repressor for pyruvate dehydrogenase complex